MLREGALIGVIVIQRTEVQPFTDRQVELVTTFADQAVIAIENVRLFQELQARNLELAEALEQQTATSEILRTISSSPTDLAPAFNTILANACRLCHANLAALWRYNGEVLLGEAHYNASRAFAEVYMKTPLRPGPEGPARKAALERRTVHVKDITAESGFSPMVLQFERARTVLAVPLLRENALVGVIAMWRREVRPFTEQQIALVQTFADQAVIAIENVRLFQELQARNRDLTDALEQQTATAEILRVISGSPTDLQPVFDIIGERAEKLCDAEISLVSTFDGELIRLAALHGGTQEGREFVRRWFPMRPESETATARAVRNGAVVHILDVLADPDYERKDAAVAMGYRCCLGVPMLREGQVIGVIFVARTRPVHFADTQVELLKTFADQAVIAIENVRLFTELREKNQALTEALEQQTTTGEILRVISSSPTDVQPTFDAIARSARKLCEAAHGMVFRFDGELIHLSAHDNLEAEQLEAVRSVFPIRPGRQSVTARAILTGALVHVRNRSEDPDLDYSILSENFPTTLAVPLLRAGIPLGAITVTRAEVRLFSDRQIELLKTFADQAVIAIENVRLFQELQARTEELGRSVQELKALGEVSQAVSSSLDLRQVLNAIAGHAVNLSNSDGCGIFEFNETRRAFDVVASHNLSGEWLAALPEMPVDLSKVAIGRAAERGGPIQIPDIAEAHDYPYREITLKAGFRALLTVPMVSENATRGITLFRRTPGRFEDRVVSLLTALANQSKVAIENARLFQEIQETGRQLEIASKHKSQFLANMSHELRTPLNAVLGYIELVLDNIFGEVPAEIRDSLERARNNGLHLLGLINDVLDLSKIEAGQLALSLAEYSIDEVVHAVVTAVESLASEKKLALTATVSPNLPQGKGDAQRITQVLLNLVGNAIKFAEAGEVRVQARASDGAFVVSVSDTGPGISPADQQKIFEEFQQADSSSTRKKGGTGLGLSIAKRIVELHGGRIWVESSPGQGSTFWFTVPVRVERQAVTT